MRIYAVRFHEEKNKKVFTKSKEFKIAKEERKIELIEIDSYNFMIKYLRGRIEYSEFYKKIKELSNFGLLTKIEITNFLKDKITYEAYQCSIGKDEEERKQIKNRLFKFKEN